jgi:hypothetical protein
MAVVATCGMVLTAQQGLATSSVGPGQDAAAEVRLLRTELQEAAASIVSAQVLVGRLQLIDRRMSFVAAQLTETRRTISDYEAKRERPLAALKRADDGAAEGLTGFEYAVSLAKAELAEIDEAVRTLRAREAQLTRTMSSEEQRWVAAEARLEQLERTATKTDRAR